MIPYDDLVDALTTWRARQGLPVAQLPVTAPRAAAPTSPRSAPPVAPPRAASSPIDASGPASSEDFDEGALVEEAAYDAGDDYVMPLGGAEPAGEATAIGAAPEAPKRW
jgi:hypothetical protein